MYRNCVYNSKESKVHLFTWDEDGNRVVRDIDFKTYLFVEDKTGQEESIYGTKLLKREFSSSFDRNKFLKDFKNPRIYENLPPHQQFLIDEFWNVNTTDDFSKHPLRTLFIDIETFSNKGKFPDIQNPEDTINLITLYDTLNNHYITFGLQPYDTSHITGKVVRYVHCVSEEQLLKRFVMYWEHDYPDIVSGWNSSGFDIPYIVNRINVVLNESWKKRLSPVGKVYERVKQNVKFGEPAIQMVIDGISSVDYMVLYQKFKLDKQESYKLDYIAEVELNEQKLEYDGQLWEFSIRDWKSFVDYNIRDVELLVNLDDKLRYMRTLRFLANIGLTNIEKAIDTVPIMNGALAVQARKRNQRIPTFVRKIKEEKNPGAYVRVPIMGFSENIVSFDANSLYPSVMISMNLSPETKIGRVEMEESSVKIHHVNGRIYELDKQKFKQYMDTEKIAIAAGGFIFSQRKKGIVPEYLDWLYTERKKMQKKYKECKSKLSEGGLSDAEQLELTLDMNRYDSIQYAYKINLNSLYGYMGNGYAQMGDDDIASSVTLTGQAAIKKSADLVADALLEIRPDITESELSKTIVYGDTDSVMVSLKCLESRGVPIKVNGEITSEFHNACEQVENYLNAKMDEWARKSLRSIDPRFVFKRETICDSAIFLKKKYYVLHVIDDEGFKCDKFKYRGVSVVKTTLPKTIKPYLKKIIETMILTKDKGKCDKLFSDAYDTFKTLPVESISSISGINTFDKYVSDCQGFDVIAKGMQAHMRAAYYHNVLIDTLNLGGNYPKLKQGDKIRYVNVDPINKYNINVIGYAGTYPSEFSSIFKIDYETMFESLMYTNIEYFYKSVNWVLRKPNEHVKFDLLAYLSE